MVEEATARAINNVKLGNDNKLPIEANIKVVVRLTCAESNKDAMNNELPAA